MILNSKVRCILKMFIINIVLNRPFLVQSGNAAIETTLKSNPKDLSKFLSSLSETESESRKRSLLDSESERSSTAVKSAKPSQSSRMKAIAKINTTSDDDQNNEKKKAKNKASIIATIVGVIVVLGCCGYMIKKRAAMSQQEGDKIDLTGGGGNLDKDVDLDMVDKKKGESKKKVNSEVETSEGEEMEDGESTEKNGQEGETDEGGGNNVPGSKPGSGSQTGSNMENGLISPTNADQINDQEIGGNIVTYAAENYPILHGESMISGMDGNDQSDGPGQRIQNSVMDVPDFFANASNQIQPNQFHYYKVLENSDKEDVDSDHNDNHKVEPVSPSRLRAATSTSVFTKKVQNQNQIKGADNHNVDDEDIASDEDSESRNVLEEDVQNAAITPSTVGEGETIPLCKSSSSGK